MDDLQPKKEADPRFQRSRASIIAAVTELVDSGPVELLSITGVVEAAGVTRPTFYQQFPDVVSAVQEAAYVRLAGAFGDADHSGAGRPTDDDLRQQIIARTTPVLEHLAEHRPFYQRVLAAAAGVEFFDRFVGLVASHMLPGALDAGERPEAFQRDVTTVMASGMMWFVLRWVSGEPGATASAAAMAQQIADVALALRP